MSSLKSVASAYGSYQGYGMALIFILVSICLCGVGASTVKNPDTQHTGTASATLSNVTCDQNGKNKQCDFTANYTVDSKPYSFATRGPYPKNNGQTMPVYYNPASPADVQQSPPMDSNTGKMEIGAGVVLFIIGCLIAYFMSQASNNTKAIIGASSFISSLTHHRNYN